MRITLSISENQRSLSDLETTKTFEQGAITIGRGADNDWVLPDPERIVSNRHCIIQYRDGEYFITDNSTNGVFVNHSEDRIERGESLKLHDHDHLSLGNYELLVRIEPATGYDTGAVTAAGLVTDIISTPELNMDQYAAKAASVPHLGESVETDGDALQASEYKHDSGEELDTEKPKLEPSKKEEYLGVTEYDWPIDKKDASAAASSESEIPDSAVSESAEEDLLKIKDLSQELAHQDIDEPDRSEDVDDSQAHSAMTSELEELLDVDEDQSAPDVVQENLADRDAPSVSPQEQLEVSEKAKTAQHDVQQEDDAEVADIPEHEPMHSDEQMVLDKSAPPVEDRDLPKSSTAPSQPGELIPEDWWSEESSQVNELPASSIALPIQETDFLFATRLAEHFQQQQKHFDLQVKRFYRYLQPYYWGIENLQLDEDALARGEIVVVLARGLMPDGTCFDTPTVDALPEPLPIGREIENAFVVLSACGEQGVMSEDHQNNPFAASSASLYNSGNVPFQIQTQRLQLRLRPGSKKFSHQPVIDIARIREVGSNQQIILDETYVPPALDCHQMPILNNHINEIRSLLQQCGDKLALELDAKSNENADVLPLLLLQIINRYEVCFTHLANTTLVHPVDLFQRVIQLAAEMATFVRYQRRPVKVTTYDHRDLGSTFASLLKELRQLLPVHRQQARQIPLKERGYGISVAAFGNQEWRLLESADLILAVHTQETDKTLTDLFSNQMTIGPVEKIAQLVNQKEPGICLSPLPEAPNGMTAQNDAVYYRLDRDCPAGQQLSTSKGLAFHVTEELSKLDMRLWVITT